MTRGVLEEEGWDCVWVVDVGIGGESFVVVARDSVVQAGPAKGAAGGHRAEARWRIK
jgi:GTPase involved in cell partitioning and DNA repair